MRGWARKPWPGAIALVAALMLVAGSPVPASATPSRRVCAAAAPGEAACTAIRLLPTPAESGPQAVRAGVTYPEPFAGFLTPEALHAAYTLPAESSSSTLQTVAVIDAFDDPTAEADLGVYDAEFHLPACTTANGCFRKVDQEGKTSPLPRKEGEWASETSIDVQMAHAICQSCRVLLVEANNEAFPNLGAAVNAAAAAGATEISNSYAGPEEPSFASTFTGYNSAYYNHPGILIAAATGDCGYLDEGCESPPGAANFPADSPDVLAVGGTTLSEEGGVWSATVWHESGGGCSQIFAAPAWQSAVAGFSDTDCGAQRSTADVAAIGNPQTGVDVYDSTPEYAGGPTGWGVWGGTSVASPIVASEFGLAGGADGASYPASTLYAHDGGAGALYDVVSGSNGSCASGDTSCRAAVGFDGPSGVGSPLGLGAFQIPGSPANASRPAISGVAEVGETLDLVPGSWNENPTSTSYQWERCSSSGGGCSAIAGATASSYPVTAADIGATIRVQETAGNAAGDGPPAASTQTAVVPGDALELTGFTPASGITGSPVTISGAAFDGASKVVLGKLAAAFTVLSNAKIEATVPNGASAGKVSVTTPAGTVTSAATFTPTLSITSVKPLSGAPGKSVTLKGVGFNGHSTVSFDGVKATVTSAGAKKLKVKVPAGAGTGPIAVTNTTAPVGTVFSASSFKP